MSKRQRSQSQLTPYVPQLLIEWQTRAPEKSFREIEGTLVFADISGFTRMSERLARKGKVGAEEVSEVLNYIFSRLLAVAREDGGDLLKFGGDALLLLFSGPEHVSRATHAAVNMRRTLRQCGRLRTSAGLVSLRMSMGIHTGKLHFFLAGDSRRELIITGPGASQTVAMESAAEAGDILLSPATAGALDGGLLGAMKEGGYLLKKAPAISPGKSDLAVPGSSLDLEAFVPVAIQRRVAARLNEGEHRLVTIGFLRFGGTDALLTRVGPSEVLGKLDRLVRAVQEAAADYEICFLGTDIDRDGGKVILTAGAPESRGNDEERMLRAVRAIADERCGLELRTGVNRGYVFAGDLGAAFARAYGILGDATNLAARLMQRAEPGQILATESVLARSVTQFKVKALEPFMVKGKARPIVAYSVGSIAGSRKRYIGRRLPLIGREQEMESLLAALRSARAGHGSVAEVVGEPGIGKSRLLEELESHCENVTHSSAACEQYESSTPYFGFRGLLGSLVGIKRGEDPKRAGAQVGEWVQAEAPELAPWLPLLAIPMDLSVPSTRECDELDSAFKRARLRQVVAEFMQKLLRGPAVLVFEDVHWMDEASGDLLRYLCEEVAAKPWLICVTRRPQDTGFVPSADLPRLTIALEPLAAQASTALATAAAGEMSLPEHQVAAVAERAGGNPLFVQELVAASKIQEGSEVLPESIEAVITSRIDRLAPLDRTFLRYAAVIGSSFDLDLLDRVLGNEARGVKQATIWNRLAEFASRESPNSYRFRHALFRDVAYEGLPYRRRRALHERVAEQLERERAGSPEELAELLSLHFHRAQRYDKAWHYSVIAGERAQAKFANVEAIEYYRRALSVADEGTAAGPTAAARAHVSLGDVHELMGNHEEAVQHYVRSVETTLGRGRRGVRSRRSSRRIRPQHLLAGVGSEAACTRRGISEICRKISSAYERRSDYNLALQWLHHGLQLLPRRSTCERSRTCVAVALVLFRTGLYDEAAVWCLRGVRCARAAGDTAELAHAYNLLGGIRLEKGQVRRAVADQLRALSMCQQLGHLSGQADTLNNLGLDYLSLGEWPQAVERFEECLRIASRIGDLDLMAIVHNNLGEVFLAQGDLARAKTEFCWTIDREPHLGHMVVGALAEANLGQALACEGRLSEARQALEGSLRIFRQVSAQSFEADARVRLAEAFFVEGRREKAEEFAREALDAARQVNSRPVEAMAIRILGRLATATEDWERAEASLATARQLFQRVGARHQEARTLVAIAELAAAKFKRLGGRRDHRRAVGSLNRAVSIFCDLGARLDLADAEALLDTL